MFQQGSNWEMNKIEYFYSLHGGKGFGVMAEVWSYSDNGGGRWLKKCWNWLHGGGECGSLREWTSREEGNGIEDLQNPLIAVPNLIPEFNSIFELLLRVSCLNLQSYAKTSKSS